MVPFFYAPPSRFTCVHLSSLWVVPSGKNREYATLSKSEIQRFVSPPHMHRPAHVSRASKMQSAGAFPPWLAPTLHVHLRSVMLCICTPVPFGSETVGVQCKDKDRTAKDEGAKKTHVKRGCACAMNRWVVERKNY